MSACELCAAAGGLLLWQDGFARVVRVDEPGYAGFCRVILQHHAAEMTDLPPMERERLMAVVWAVESALRKLYQPAKINLASLGNLVPHLHWHVIPRFADDPHFPRPLWAQALRQAAPRAEVTDQALRLEIAAALAGQKPLPSPARIG